MAESDHRKGLDAWSRVHAIAMLAASACSVPVGRPWPLGAAGAASFSILLISHRAAWTREARVFAPNVVTTLRLAIAVALCVVLHGAPAATWATAGVVVYALDGFDGWLARRTGGTS